VPRWDEVEIKEGNTNRPLKANNLKQLDWKRCFGTAAESEHSAEKRRE